MNDFKRSTIVFPIKDDRVLLGMKKYGHGEGWWNGFGGKLEAGETFEESAIRETEEEAGIIVSSIRLVARIIFYFDEGFKFGSAVFVTQNFSGEPRETDEMRPEWFPISKLPTENMWPGDKVWMPQSLMHTEGDEILEHAIYFDKDKQFLKSEKPDAKIISEVFLTKT